MRNPKTKRTRKDGKSAKTAVSEKALLLGAPDCVEGAELGELLRDLPVQVRGPNLDSEDDVLLAVRIEDSGRLRDRDSDAGPARRRRRRTAAADPAHRWQLRAEVGRDMFELDPEPLENVLELAGRKVPEHIGRERESYRKQRQFADFALFQAF